MYDETTDSQAEESSDDKYFGKYRATVIDNEDGKLLDGQRLGRLLLRIPSVGNLEAWAMPCFPFGGGPSYGWFAVPEKDANVWAEFEAGDLSRPIWTGVFWDQEANVPEEAVKEKGEPPTTRVFRTPSGHVMQFDDKEGEETFRLFHPSEAEISINEDGSLVLQDSSGANITLDAEDKTIIVEDANQNQLIMNDNGISVVDKNGNKIVMDSSGITIKGNKILIQGDVMLGTEGGMKFIKESFMDIFNNHMHPTAGLGPPSIPVVPMMPPMLTTKVTAT
ncbi:MAG: phage baseplate assembly protein V [Betaproteobacteria bacterium]|nr:phage baseplate assembly protein V [Betaproteobacteria bacterium]